MTIIHALKLWITKDKRTAQLFVERERECIYEGHRAIYEMNQGSSWLERLSLSIDASQVYLLERLFFEEF
tara:strand:- start:627 stop:836 length:210 start_codon:yes stop_codon:yes gene_type:complete